MTEIVEAIAGILLILFSIALLFSLFALFIAVPFIIIGWGLGAVTWSFCMIAPVC